MTDAPAPPMRTIDAHESQYDALARLDERGIKSPQWQYLAISFPYNSMGSFIMGANELGESGWEMFTILAGAGSHTAVFRRKMKPRRGKS